MFVPIPITTCFDFSEITQGGIEREERLANTRNWKKGTRLEGPWARAAAQILEEGYNTNLKHGPREPAGKGGTIGRLEVNRGRGLLQAEIWDPYYFALFLQKWRYVGGSVVFPRFRLGCPFRKHTMGRMCPKVEPTETFIVVWVIASPTVPVTVNSWRNHG